MVLSLPVGEVGKKLANALRFMGVTVELAVEFTSLVLMNNNGS
jgi:hypothetical protein